MIKRILIVLAVFATSLALWAGERVIHHQPKLIIKDPASSARAETAKLAAEQYVAQNWETFQLAPKGDNLILERTQQSLLGTHFHYRQYLHGLPVEKATFVVTVDREQRVTKIYNNTFPVTSVVAEPPQNLISGDDALLISWDEVGVTGNLVTAPQAKLCYRYEKGAFELIWRTEVAVSEPIGDWKLALNPQTGRVLALENMLVMHRRGQTVKEPSRPRDHWLAGEQPPLRDFYEAMDSLDQHMAKREARTNRNKRRVNGTGIVFDPDPRTTLLDFTLEDNVDEAVVSAAYQYVTLRDITQNEEGIFELKGPFVSIETLAGGTFAPDTPPSTTADGNWNFARGDSGFNDATVYYQLDKNQRYLQSLGFTGDFAIQNEGVLADTDAWGGADNSFFFEPNSLAFGKGGVDDAEDADVVLHEYGHAIQQFIVSTWDVRGDADEGGMGEGFGDYWAGSYSLSTPNGYKGFPNLVFSWDGHNNNWPGRRLDRLDLVYNRDIGHDDHQCVVPTNQCFSSGGESDELWSAPLFQTLLELYRRGYPREELDRVVVQSHFGIGDSVKMFDMSAATINTAQQMQPNGPHAQTLKSFFATVGIEEPIASYSYIAPHIPFCQTDDSGNCGQTDGFWYSWVEIANPNPTAATVTLETFGANDDNQYVLLDTQTIEVAAGATSTFNPPGFLQRWVKVTSNQPLGGYQYFERTGLEAGQGTEKAAIPLLTDLEVANELILPHVPANREGFWSGSVIVNTTDQEQTVTLVPIGDNGTDLSSQFDAQSLSYTFAPFEKKVSFITPVASFGGSLVDDSALQEKVSYLRLVASGDIAAFELFGYNAANAGLATTGIVASPDQDRTAWSIRTALADADWNGFTILNPSDAAVDLNVSVYDEQGNLMGSATTSIAARTKLLGLNTTAAGLSFPSNATPILNVADADQAATVVIQAYAPLRIFDLSGDLANTTIDGGAVQGLTTKTLFTNPVGSLRLMQAIEPETVTVETYVRLGENLVSASQTYDLAAGETRIVSIQDNAETIVVRGAFVNPSVILRDSERNTLTIRNGHQIEIGPNGN